MFGMKKGEFSWIMVLRVRDWGGYLYWLYYRFGRRGNSYFGVKKGAERGA
jgi:hypothetical protein